MDNFTADDVIVTPQVRNLFSRFNQTADSSLGGSTSHDFDTRRRNFDQVTADSLKQTKCKSTNDSPAVENSPGNKSVTTSCKITNNFHEASFFQDGENRINWALNHSPNSGYPECQTNNFKATPTTSNNKPRLSSPDCSASSASWNSTENKSSIQDKKQSHSNYLDSKQEINNTKLTQQIISIMKELKDLSEVARVIDEVDDEEWLLMFIGELEVFLSDVIKMDSPGSTEPFDRVVKKKKTLLGVAVDLVEYLRRRCKFTLTRHESAPEGRDESDDEDASTMLRMKRLVRTKTSSSMSKWQRKLSSLAQSLDKYLELLTSFDETKPGIPNVNQTSSCQSTPNQTSQSQTTSKPTHETALPSDFLKDLDQISLKTESQTSDCLPSAETDRSGSSDVYRYYVEVDSRESKPTLVDLGDMNSDSQQSRAKRYICPRTKDAKWDFLNTSTPDVTTPSTSSSSHDVNTDGTQPTLTNKHNPVTSKVVMDITPAVSSVQRDSSVIENDVKQHHHFYSPSSENVSFSRAAPIPKQRSKPKDPIDPNNSENIESKERSSSGGSSLIPKPHHVSEWKREVERVVRIESLPVATSYVQCDIVSMEIVTKSDKEIQKLRKSAEMLRRGITEAREDRDEKERKITILETKVQRLKKSIEANRTEKGSTSEEVERLRCLLDKEKRNSDLKIAELEKKCKDLRTEESRKRERIKDLEQWIENLKKENESSKETSNVLQQEKQELEQKIYDTTMMLMKEKRHNRRLNVENVELEVQVSSYKEELSLIQAAEKKRESNPADVLSNVELALHEQMQEVQLYSAELEEKNKELQVSKNKLQQELQSKNEEAVAAADCFRQQVEFLSSEVSIQRHAARTQKENYDREFRRLLSSNSANQKIEEEFGSNTDEEKSLRSQLVCQETLTRTLYAENERLREERNQLKTQLKSESDESSKRETQDFSCQMDDLTYTRMRAHDYYLQESQHHARRLKERGCELRQTIKQAQEKNLQVRIRKLR